MIYITNLIYIKENTVETFEEYESIAIPIIARYNGRLLLRIRPENKSVISADMPVPFEIHFVEFASESDFNNFQKDEERKKFLYLKERTIHSNFLVMGQQLSF
jgi:uncharacterized protein (DUF1330 family)